MTRLPATRLVALAVLVASLGLAAVWLGPARTAGSRDPRPVLSTRSLDFSSVPVGAADAEMLLTVRNDGRGTLVEARETVDQRDYAAVCPASLGVHVRMSECGFTVAGAADPACHALEPGASCALAVAFRPRTVGPYAARLCVAFATTDGDPREGRACLALSGTGVRP